jgi:acyl-CoA synthetase (NDP forming)/RimJ/RimL family protein N-acetyltransferase
MFRIIPEGMSYKEHVLLKNGQGIFFKPAESYDQKRVKDFMSRLSQESLRMRFMASVSEVSDQIILDLCTGDFKERGCLLASVGEDNNAKVIGLANYISMGNNRTAEVAFLIEDSYQGLGISTLLMERLSGIAAANGIIEFEAEVLPDNQQMMNVFKSSGFDIHKVWHSDTVHIEFPVDGASSLWKRTALRERIAVANSLMPLLRPKIIAVVGAEKDPDSIGNMIFKNILTSNFNGTVYPINDTGGSVNGVRSYPLLSDLPDKIDLSIISLPAEKVIAAAESSIKAGAKAIVVVSTGFAEIGEEGKARQKELLNLVRSHGVRLLGPSCLGLMNTDSDIRLNASLIPQIILKGKIGLFAHSAALGLVILNYAHSLGLSFTTFISAGNRADISGNDFLQYWEEDPNTKIVILYLETFGNPRKFVRIARSMSYKKPILCVKSASSVAGRKTIEAKSGGITGGSLEIEALFRQTGVILAPTLEELFDTAIVLENQPLPDDNKVGIIANSAGMATIFADACETNNLIIEDGALINLGAFASSDKYGMSALELLKNENVNSILIGFASVGKDISNDIALSIRNAVNQFESESGKSKPVILCLMGTAGAVTMKDEHQNIIDEKKFPSFRFPESAVRALSRIVNYSEFRKTPPGKIVWYNDVKAEDARILVNKIIRENNTGQNIIEMSSSDSGKLFELFGISIARRGNIPENPILLEIKSDPLFGPIIELNVGENKKLVRITPLTDRDLEETFQFLKVNAEEGLKQVMGRLSQMIEELPWLNSLKIKIAESKDPTIYEDYTINMNIHNISRPTY